MPSHAQTSPKFVFDVCNRVTLARTNFSSLNTFHWTTLCVKERNGAGTWRSFRSDVGLCGQFLRKMPLLPPMLHASSPFLPTFECSLSFRAHHHSTAVKHFAFSRRRTMADHYSAFGEKRVLRRRSASLVAGATHNVILPLYGQQSLPLMEGARKAEVSCTGIG